MKSALNFDVIVVGAGIIGASIAWHLSQKGKTVCVLDSKGPAAAASGASDGAVSVCSKRPGLMATLAHESLGITKELARDGGPLNTVFKERPSFIFARGEEEDTVVGDLANRLEKAKGATRVYKDHQLPSDAINGLSASITRLLEVHGEGHMLGYDATFNYLTDEHVKKIYPANLLSWEQRPSGAIRVTTSSCEIECDQLVLATGLGTSSFFPDLPIYSHVGQIIVTDRGGGEGAELPGALTSAAYLMSKIRADSQKAHIPVVLDPVDTGQLLIGSSRERGRTTRHTDFSTVKRLLISATEAYPPLALRRVIRVFAGARSAVEDGLPIVGAVPDMPNVHIVTGFEGDGICLSALMGREVSKSLCGGTLDSSLAALSPARFLSSATLPCAASANTSPAAHKGFIA
ncbi:FAD-binding oxidoreductase [uncultured Cohaesibacter sp.]|uniref:NAD(P)/FAD-dependent oxidoreductase n=1 Tax=uncultured Cohaesibacter sp. TaxID=1002546 RepID=UPI0029C68F19|nr:FAD-binding oxidoreductase [uncultured Cohaesibacter sp.]